MYMDYKFTDKKNNEAGFALLMSLIVVGVLISIGLTVLELTVAQISLSTNARDSERAFHAANAGVECALYTRRQISVDMEAGNAITPTCFGVGGASAPSTIMSTVDGDAFLYNYNFTWGTNNDRCSEITTLVASTTPDGAGLTINNMSTHVPGYPVGNTLDCVAGARCTVISVRGYNKVCSAISTFGTVQREVLLQL